MPDRTQQEKYLTTQGFVDHIRATTGIPLTKTHLRQLHPKFDSRRDRKPLI